MDQRGLTSPLQGTLFIFTGNYERAHPERTERLRDVLAGLVLSALTLGAAMFWAVSGPATQSSAADVLARLLS